MNSLQTLFEVEIAHAFFEPAPCTGLSLVPSAATAALLDNCRCLFCPTSRGIKLLYDKAFTEALRLRAEDATEALRFSFLGRTQDPLFANYTEGPVRTDAAIPFFDSDDAMREDDAAGRWRLHAAPFVSHADCVAIDAAAISDRLTRGERWSRPRFIVDIHVDAAQLGAPRRYVVHFQARATVWKYWLIGPWSDAPLLIVDPDSTVDFAAATSEQLANGQPALAIRSARPIRLQRQPRMRLQLHASGDEAGSVLMKRLPEADGRYFGSEPDADGTPVLVSEIYLHR